MTSCSMDVQRCPSGKRDSSKLYQYPGVQLLEIETAFLNDLCWD
jgi:hypothetical protein